MQKMSRPKKVTQDSGAKGMFRSLKTLIGLPLLAWVGATHAGEPLPISPFDIPQGAYSAEFIQDRDQVTVMEFTGNLDRNLSSGEFNAAARAVIAQEFYENHPDTYDFLVVFSSFEYDTGDALAFHAGVRNDIQGIGIPEFDNTELYGSNGKLQSYIDMAALSRYEINPTQPEFNQVINILGHEVLHRWGSRVHFRNESNERDNSLLGRQNAHWSFFLDSDASVEYGSDWRDNGDGTFTAVATDFFYSPLDLYLMGFYSPEQVQPLTLLNSSTEEFNRANLPVRGVTIPATPRTVTIDQIVAEEGPRIPNEKDSQKEFRFAFIYVVAPNEEPAQEVFNGLRDIRRHFAERFAITTGGKGIATIFPEPEPVELGELDLVVSDEAFRVDGISIEDGIDWLIAEREDNPYWQDKESTRLRDTAVVTEILRDLVPGYSDDPAVLSFLREQSVNNADTLARLFSVLSDQALSEQLVSRQNDDGGWGLLPQYDSTALDTALVLSALSHSNDGVSFNQQGALDFLTGQQNSDGGWPSVSGSVSTVRATVAVLNALANIGNSEVINSGLTWLSQQTDASGGFGDATASIHETALAVRTFSRLEQLEMIDFTAALSFIAERQRLGGHWEGSVYSTALAISALQSVNLPNLRALNISVDNTQPTDGELVSATAVINNDSSQAVNNVIVQFFVGDSSNRIPLNDPIVISELTAYSSVTVNTVWNTFDAAGNHRLMAVIDVDNTVLERSENDNIQTLDITVSSPALEAELAVSNADFIVTPNQPNRLPVDIAVSATARNLGLVATSEVTAQLLRNEVLVNEAIIAIPARGTVALNFVDQLSSPGVHEYEIVLDANDSIAEVDETNNTATQTVITQPGIDLEITQAAIESPDTAILFNNVNFLVTIYNRSTVDASDVDVIFNVINVEGTTQLDTQTVNVPAGQSITREITWRANVSGETNFQVILDPNNLIAELDESNNDVVKPVVVNAQSGANASVNFSTIGFNPNPALQGLDTVVTARISNAGTELLSGLEVALFDNNPASGGNLLDTVVLPDINAGEESPVTLVWEATPELNSATLYVVVDPNNTLAETNEEDNIAFDSLDILSLPDLEITTGSLSLTPVLPVPNEQATLTITATNIGNQTAENIPVVVSIDGRELAGNYEFGELRGNGNASIEVPVTFDSQGEHTISVEIDPNNTVAELQVTNNQAERSINIQDGNFFVTERYISPDGDGEQDVSEFNFTLDEPLNFDIVILNEDNEVVATVDNNFASTTSGNAVWNGRRESGAIAADGDYWFAVRAVSTGTVIGSTKVVVDTNRSPLLEAIDSEFGVTRNLSCAVGEIFDFQGFNHNQTRRLPEGGLPGPVYGPNDEFVYFITHFEGAEDFETGQLVLTDDRTRFRSGIYRAFSDGTNVTQIIPDEFLLQVAGDSFEFRANSVTNIIVSDNGQRLAVMTTDQTIWLMNTDGSDVRAIYNSAASLTSGGSSINGDVTGIAFTRSGTSLFLTSHNLTNNSIELYDIDFSLQNSEQLPSVVLVNEVEVNLYEHLNTELSPTIEFSSDGTRGLIKFEEPQIQEDPENYITAIDALLERENNHLFWVDLNTSSLEYISARGAVFKWSPDGQRFAFGDGITRSVEIRSQRNTPIQQFSFPRQFPESITVETLENTGLDPSQYPSVDMLYGRFAALSWAPDGRELGVLVEDYLDAHLRSCVLCAIVEFPQQLIASFSSVQGVYTLDTRDSTINKIAEVAPLPAISPIDEVLFSEINHYVELVVERQLGRVRGENDDEFNNAFEDLLFGEFGEIFLTGTQSIESYEVQLQNFSNFNLDRFGSSNLPVVTWIQNDSWVFRNSIITEFDPNIFESFNVGLSVDGNLQWLPGSRSILITAGPDNNYGEGFRFPIFTEANISSTQVSLINVDDPQVFEENFDFRFPVGGFTNAITSSNTGRFLTYFNTNEDRQCTATRGNYEQFQSLLNLSVDVRAQVSRAQGGIVVIGTATDKNFSNWILEYASSQTPNDWNLISPASTELVIDEQLTTWVPPSRGSFFIRLTATDKAGNSRADITQVSFSDDTSVTNVFRQPAYISPNGDGIQDNLEMHFRVLQPVNISMQIENENGDVVRTITQSFDEIGVDTQLNWDGRNNAGVIVADGVYRIVLQNFEFFVTLDRNSPTLSELNNQFSWGVSFENELPYTNRCFSRTNDDGSLCATYISEQLGYSLSDTNLNQQSIEFSPAGGGDWRDSDIAPTPLAEGANNEFVIPVTHDLLSINNYRVVASDRAGNQSVLVVGSQNQNRVEAVRAVTVSEGEQIILQPRDALSYSTNVFDPERLIAIRDNDSVVVEISESIQSDTASIELLYAPIVEGVEPSSESFLPLFVESFAPVGVEVFEDSIRGPQVIPATSLLPAITLTNYDLIDTNFVAVFNRSDNGLNNDTGYYVRIRITDSAGNDHLSKSLVIPPRLFQFGFINGVLVDESQGSSRKTVRSYLTELDPTFIQRASFYVQSNEDLRFTERRLVDTYVVDGSRSSIQSRREFPELIRVSSEQVRIFPFDVSSLDSCTNYEFTIEYILSDGREVTFTESRESDCADIEFTVVPAIPESCNISVRPEFTATSIITLPEDLVINDEDLNFSVLTFSMLDENGNEDVFSNINAPTLNTLYTAVFDANDLEGGTYIFRSTLTDSSGEILSVESQTVPYESAPPSVEILSPLNSQRICANSFIGRGPTQILNAVEVSAELMGRDSLFYRLEQRESGAPENSGETIFCNGDDSLSVLKDFVCLNSTSERELESSIERFEEEQVSSLQSFADQQELSVVNIRNNLFTNEVELTGTAGFATYSSSQSSQLTLSAYNWSGHNACAVVEFEVDAEVEGFEVNQVAFEGLISRIFSPNQDGIQDQIASSISTEEFIIVDVELFNAVSDTEGNELVKGSSLGSVVSELELDAGIHNFNWDGQLQSGEVPTNGTYILEFVARDGCGLFATQQLILTIDNSAPNVDLVFPRTSDLLGLNVEVSGTVNDANLSEFLVFITDTNSDGGRVLINSGRRNVSAADVNSGILLANWNTFGLTGSFNLEIEATDQAGNKTLVSEVLDLALVTELISEFGVTELYTSPNGDGLLDTAVIRTRFESETIATFTVTDASGNLVRTISSEISYEPTFASIIWDGRDDSGELLADGIYTLIVDARSAVSEGLTQREEATIILDVTSPEVTLPGLNNGRIELAGGNAIIGSINDRLFDSYSVTLLTGPNNVSNTELIFSQVLPSGQLVTLNSSIFQEEGFYQLEIIARDLAQNRTAISASMLIDRTAPSVLIAEPNNGSVVRSDINSFDISGQITDNFFSNYSVELVRDVEGEIPSLIIDSQESVPSSLLASVDVSNLEEGRYIATVIARDLSGLTTENSVSFSIDNTAPSISIENIGNNGFIVEPTSIRGTIRDDNLRQYEVAIAENVEGSVSEFTPVFVSNNSVVDGSLYSLNTLPEDGSYTLRFIAEDLAGNSRNEIVSFIVDTTPPDIPVLDDVVVNANELTASLTWTAVNVDDLAGYRVYRNGQLISQELITATQFTDSSLAEGDYSYAVSAVDNATLESELSNTSDIRVDLTGPEVFISQPGLNQVVGGLVDITGTAFSESDFKRYSIFAGPTESSLQLVIESTLSQRGANLAQWNSLSVSTDQPYLLRLEAEDQSGNISFVDVTVQVDNEAPPAVTNLQASVVNGEINLSWDFSTSLNEVAGFLLYRNNELVNAPETIIGDLLPFVIEETSFVDTGLVDGEYTYTVFVLDEGGNISDPSDEASVVLNNNLPRAEIININNGERFENSLYLLADSDDNDISSVEFSYRQNETDAWQVIAVDFLAPFETEWDSSALEFGPYQIRALATDNFASLDPEPELLNVVKADITPPSPIDNLDISVNGSEVSLVWSNLNVEADFASYSVYAENLSIANPERVLVTTNLTDTSFIHLNSDLGEMKYSISVLDQDGNESELLSEQTELFTPTFNILLSPQPTSVISVAGSSVPGSEIVLRNSTISNGETTTSLGLANSEGSFSVESEFLLEGENTLSVFARHPVYDSVSNISEQVITYIPPPSQVEGLIATYNESDANVSLQWQANTESEIFGYYVYRNNEPVEDNRLVDYLRFSTNSASRFFPLSNIIESGSFWRSRAATTIVTLQFGRMAAINSIVVSGSVPNIEVTSTNNGVVIPVTRSGSTLTLDTPYITDAITLRFTGFEDGYRINSIETMEIPLVRSTSFIDVPDNFNVIHSYQVSAFNNAVGEGPLSELVSVAVGDIVAPDEVVLSASLIGPVAELSWEASASSDVGSYRVYRNGNLIATVSELNYSDGPLLNGTYDYAVKAVDIAGNTSEVSNVVSLTVSQPILAPPTQLSALVDINDLSVTLNWQAAPGVNPTSYQVSRRIGTDTEFTVIGSSVTESFVDNNVETNRPYLYVVRAIDSIGNISLPSNVAEVVLEDNIPPAEPVLYIPTTSDAPLDTELDSTLVAGEAELGSEIYLIDNGNLLPDTIQLPEANADAVATFGELLSTTFSKDGRAAIVYSNANLEFGQIQTYSQIPSGWFQEGFVGKSSRQSFWRGDQLLFVDISPPVAKLLITESTRDNNDFTETVSEWTIPFGDGVELLAYFEDTDELLVETTIPELDGFGLYAINIDSGEIRLFDYFNWQFISRDGRFFINTQDLGEGTEITIWDRLVREVQVYVVDSLCCNQEIRADNFNRAGNQIIYTRVNTEGNYDVVRENLVTGESTILIAGLINRPTDLTWSFAEQGFFFIDREAEAELKYQRFESTEQIVLFSASIEESNAISIGGAGLNRVVLSAGFDKFYSVDLSWVFSFENVSLQLGANTFSALAVDPGQNISDASESIVINRIENIPDLSVSLELSQNTLLGGDTGILNVSVVNNGTEISDQTDISVNVFTPTGEELELLNSIVPSLDSSQRSSYTVRVDTADIGAYIIVVVVNDSGNSPEVNLLNNVVTDVLVTREQLVPFGELRIIPSIRGNNEFSANEVLSGVFEISNPGSQSNGRYVIQVEDDSGFIVEVLTEGGLNLSNIEENLVVNFNWSTDLYFADAYKLVANIVDESGVIIDSQNIDFSILPTLNLISGVTSDRSSYSAFESVNLRGTIASRNSNVLFDSGRVQFRVTDSSNIQIFEADVNIGQLLPNGTTTVSEVWNTQSSAPGNYTVTMLILDNNDVLRSSSINQFNIQSSLPNLNGLLDISESNLAKGRLLESEYSIGNLSNRALNNVSIETAIVNPETNEILISNSEIIDLQVGSRVESDTSFDTTPLDLGTYQLLLTASVVLDSQEFTFELAQELFVLQDSEAPSVEILSPSEGEILNGFSSSALIEVTDEDSLISVVEFSFDNQNWLPVDRDETATDSYRLFLNSLTDGSHQLSVRAIDSANNTSNVVTREFTVDNTAPEVVADGIINGRFYNEPITPTFTATDPHLVSLTVTLDDEPYSEGATVSSEGEHIFNLLATDSAGNVNQTIIVFGIDTTPPSINVTGVEDNGLYNFTVLPVIETDDQNPLSVVSRLNGEVYEVGTSIGTEGNYQLEIDVTDAAGNDSELLINFVIDLTSPPAPIVTSHVDSQIISQEMINLFGSVEANSTVTLSLQQDVTTNFTVIADEVGNYTFNGISLVDGDNVFELVATDRAGNSSEITRITLDRSIAATAEIMRTPDYIGNSVLVWLPTKSFVNHPNCNLWIHRNHPLGYAHAHEDAEALHELLVETFEENNTRYLVVRNEGDFIEALRSQRYNSVLIAHLNESYNLPLIIKGDALLELRASIASGTGALVITNSHNSFGVWRDLLGVKLNRVLIDPQQLSLEDSLATEAGSWEFSDRAAVQLESFGGLSVGRIEHRCNRYSGRRCSNSALTINRYGEGDVAVLGFNPAGINDTESGKTIVNNLVEFIRPDQPSMLPGGLVEVNWVAEGIEPPADVTFEQVLDSGLSYDTVIEGNLISGQDSIWEVNLSESEIISFSALINVPDEVGRFEINSDLTINGTLAAQNQSVVETTQTITNIEAQLEDDLRNALNKATWHKKGLYKWSLVYVQQAISIDKLNRRNTDRAINSLLLATFKLKLLGETQLISEVGNLVKVYQRQWYELPEQQTYGKFRHFRR